MEVMKNHEFFDSDVEKVRNDGHQNNREIVLKKTNGGSLLINKEDVIALAKEFDLIVFKKEDKL